MDAKMHIDALPSLTIRGARKRRWRDGGRNWIVTHCTLWFNPTARTLSARERKYTCLSWDDALAVANAIARDDVIDARRVIALERRWIK